MQIGAEFLSPGWLWACRVAATIAVALAARRLDWKALLQDAPTLHRFAACTVGLLVLWSIRATVAEGPGLHILGVTTVTLVLSTGRPVPVPPLIGKRLPQAMDILRRAGLRVGKVTYTGKRAVLKKVVGQNPSSNTKVAKGTAVDLKVQGKK